MPGRAFGGALGADLVDHAPAQEARGNSKEMGPIGPVNRPYTHQLQKNRINQ
jgi:hypothetical protein